MDKKIDKMEFPMRINRYLALQGYCTRREADTLIEKGRVLINGAKAKLGDKVNEKDKVELLRKENKKYEYRAYFKPEGEEMKEKYGKLFPVGRLDMESEGLLILTNDGRITDRLLNPDREHSKIYEVRVDKPIKNHFLKILGQRVDIEGYRTKPAEVEQLDELSFSIALTEGKKHQIRRMCAALGYQVRNLKRVQVMNIKLGRLKPGQERVLEGKELETFLKKLGL